MNEQQLGKLKQDIKLLIINTLNITNIDPSQVMNNEQLFAKDNTLGLDSIDAIEIVMALQNHYGVRIGDQNLARYILESIDSIAEFLIKENAVEPQVAN